MRRWILGVPGGLALGAGGWKAVTSDTGTAGAVLVIVGALLLVAPFVVDRVERVSVGGSGLELALSRNIAEQGAPKTAAIIDRSDLARLTEAYGVIREVLPDPDYRQARSHIQDILIRRAARISEREKFDAGEIRALFANGAPVVRVMVLGLMRGDPSLADAVSLAEAIAQPSTQTEQYEALNLADRMWERFSVHERAMIQSAAKSVSVPAASSRHALIQKILATS
jgi:hypothetical protein